MTSIYNLLGNNCSNSATINLPNIKVSDKRITLLTNGTEQLYIDSAGKVGIGTANPNQLLHLYQNNSDEVQLKITNSSTTNGVLIGLTADEDFQIRQRDNKSLIFYTNDTQKMTILPSGNVGIGTTNPSELLHLNNSSGSCQIRMLSNGSTNGGLFSVDSGGDYLFRMRDNKNMKFQTNDTERVRINGAGNVGIGTTNPAKLLQLSKSDPTGWGDFLFVNNTSTAQFSATTIYFGNAVSNGNTGSLNYVYDSSGSANNYISLGLRGAENALNINYLEYVGLGLTNPTFQLQLSTDSAAKPTTSTWTISSDARVKENVIDADLSRCYSDIKKLRLCKFKWVDSYIENHKLFDRSQLGFIADEAKLVNPKSVLENKASGYDDFKTLNKDQLIMSLFGCVKRIQNKLEKLVIALNEADNFNQLEELLPAEFFTLD